MQDIIQEYLAAGASLTPIKKNAKSPILKDWGNKSVSEEKLLDHAAKGGNVGMVIKDDMVVVDVDPRNGGWESLARLEKKIGEKIERTVETPSGGFHAYYKGRSEALRKNLKEFPGIDILSEGSQVLIVGCEIDGKKYVWTDEDFGCVEFADVPTGLVKTYAKGERARPTSDDDCVEDLRDFAGLVGRPGAMSEEAVKELLAKLDPSIPNDEWVKVGMALKDWHPIFGLELWEAWSLDGDNWTEGDAEKRWRSFDVTAGSGGVTLGTVVHMARNEADFKISPMTGGSEKIQNDLKLLTIPEMDARPPVKFLVPSLLPEKGVAVLAGQSGTMKSFCAISVGLTAATGGVFFDDEIEQTNCLFMLNEGQGGFARRCIAWQEYHHIQNTDAFKVIETTPNLMRSESLEPFIDLIESEKFNPGLIIIDTFSKATIGGEDNSTKDMGMAMGNAYNIANHFNALVILIDHMGKDTKRGVRGAYAKHAAADMVGHVSKIGDTVTIKTAKQKEAEDDLKFDFDIEHIVIDGESVPVLISRTGINGFQRLTPQREFILSTLDNAENEEMKRDDLCSIFLNEYGEGKKGSFRTQLHRMINCGDVEVYGEMVTTDLL